MKKIHYVITLVLWILIGYLYVQVQDLKPEKDTPKKGMPGVTEPSDADHVSLGALMGHMQRYAEKLYWAVDAENAPLADFYLHEMEEVTEDILAAQLTKNGHDITKFTRLHLLPQVEQLEKAVAAANWPEARNAYRTVVQSCNNCHVATGYPFIQMQVPTQPAWSNQNFAPKQ